MSTASSEVQPDRGQQQQHTWTRRQNTQAHKKKLREERETLVISLSHPPPLTANTPSHTEQAGVLRKSSLTFMMSNLQYLHYDSSNAIHNVLFGMRSYPAPLKMLPNVH